MPHSYAYRWLAQAMVTILGFGSGGLGLALLLGGPQRFVSPGFATARQIPGSYVTWGLLFLAGSVLTLAGAWRKHFHLTRIGLFVTSLGYLFFDVSLFVTAINDPHTALTGAVSYFMLAATGLVVWGTSKELT